MNDEYTGPISIIGPGPVITPCDQVLKGLFKADDVSERLKQIELQQDDLMTSMQKQENLMNLIVKLLDKDESPAILCRKWITKEEALKHNPEEVE
jgi:hypothetical protein